MLVGFKRANWLWPNFWLMFRSMLGWFNQAAFFFFFFYKWNKVFGLKFRGNSLNTLQRQSVYIRDISLASPPFNSFYPLHQPSSIISTSLTSELWCRSTSTVPYITVLALSLYPPVSDITLPSCLRHHHQYLLGRKPRRKLGGHRVAGSDVDFENWVFCICIFTELKNK